MSRERKHVGFRCKSVFIRQHFLVHTVQTPMDSQRRTLAQRQGTKSSRMEHAAAMNVCHVSKLSFFVERRKT